MLKRNAKLIAGVAVAAVALAVGLTVWLTSSSAPQPLTHGGYVQLYLATTVGKTRLDTVLDTWPNPPAQDFHDGVGHRCLEWVDSTKTLYDMCFDKAGTLVRKDTP